ALPTRNPDIVAGHFIQKGFEDRGLADTRFSGKKDDLPGALRGLGKSTPQALQFLISADHRRSGARPYLAARHLRGACRSDPFDLCQEAVAPARDGLDK